MSSAPVRHTYSHIAHDALGVPIIAGTTLKVIELVLAQRAHGWSPEELVFQFPYLSMGQVHAALAYYWDNRDELDIDIDRRSALASSLHTEFSGTPLAQRLAGMKPPT